MWTRDEMTESRALPNVRICVLLCWILVFATPVLARSWRIADFEDTITIQHDGSANVNERITLVFVGEWHGIHRTIPVEYPGPRTTNYTLFLDVKSVTEDGHRLKYE